ncbi:MAG: carboxylesterase family protein, partial [Terriglobales bacterium]
MTLHRYLIKWSIVVTSLAVTPSYCAQANTTMSSPSHAKHSSIVDAPAGKIEGLAEGKLHIFKGIPYVLPPVGPARWKPSSPMPRWKGVRKAVEFGPACLQPKPQLSTVYT